MLKGGDFLSEQKKEVQKSNNHQTNKTTNQIKQQLNTLTKSSKRKLQALNVKNRLKMDQLKTKLADVKITSTVGMEPLHTLLEPNSKPSQLRLISRFTTIFSGVVITGLSVGLLIMSRPMITQENFNDKMQQSMDSAFLYNVTDVNTQNGTISYHTPRQFQYRYSLGVNDIIKYKDNEIIMHYNNQYNIIGQDMDTYYLLRDENKVAGEEVFYKNFNNDEQNGFVQLVKMDEKYLLTVFIDGTKLSAIIDYEETPYMTYNMLVLGKTVKVDSTLSTQSQVANAKIANTPEVTATESATEVPVMKIDESGNVETEVGSVIDGELSTVESEKVIDFDFSTEKRGEFTDTTKQSEQGEQEVQNEGN